MKRDSFEDWPLPPLAVRTRHASRGRWLVLVFLAGTSATAQESEDQRFRAFAASLPHLSPGGFLYERDFEDVRRFVDGVSTSTISGRLRSPESRVRALALVALCWKAGPQLLPTVVEFADDGGGAPPQRMANHTTPLVPGTPPWTVNEQTVGTISRAIADFYMEAAGYPWGIEGTGGERGFSAYWTERRGRKECLSWLQVSLLRASQRSYSTRPERVANIQELRRRIDGLEPP